MRFRRLLHGSGLLVVSFCALLVLAGCDPSGNPTDQPQNTLVDRNISAVATPGNAAQLEPVSRVPRAQYGRVPLGQFVDGSSTPQNVAVDGLFFPGLNQEERNALAAGLGFFTTPHDPTGNDPILQANPFLRNVVRAGAGPVSNQFFCIGCHRSGREGRDDFTNDASSGDRFLTTDDLANGVTPLLSNDTQVARAARATVTNFRLTSTGSDGTFETGGQPADSCDRNGCDAIGDTGDTDAFTIFGDFSASTGTFLTLEVFGGSVQHTRSAIQGCIPDAILPVARDPFLQGGNDPVTGVSALGFRRAIGERAGPPYVGRGLMEAIFDADFVRLEDPTDIAGHASLLVSNDESAFACPEDCISGRHNENVLSLPVGGDTVVRASRFGLRAAGPTIVQFVLGGMFGELGFTNPFFPNEPANSLNATNPACVDNVPDPNVPDTLVFSTRNFIRMTAPPELGANLLSALAQAATRAPTNSTADCAQLDLSNRVESVLCGALLFGVDPIAFANRIVGPMPAGGDSRDPNAINRTDQGLDCAGCHTPVHATGTSPSEVGTRHLSNKWAHVFSDLLIHDMGEVTAERTAPTPRNPVRVTRSRVDAQLQVVDGPFTTLDLSRSLADDALPGQALANGREWRTPPLWGMGLTSPPFLHDARVYLSNRTVDLTPGGTVFSHGGDVAAGIAPVTNAPLVIRDRDDAVRAAIELHDLPLPDDANTTQAVLDLGGGCPAPGINPNVNPDDVPARAGTAPVAYGNNPAAVICPPLSSGTRSEARVTILRWRRLPPDWQQALINFLKEL